MTATFTRHNPRPLLRTALIVAAYLCAFIILDLLSHQFEELRGVVAWYPPAGLTYALLLMFGVKFTPAVTIALLISSVFIYHMPQPPHLLLLWALIISSIYGVAAAFLRHRIRFDWQLRKSRDVTWLVMTAVVVSALLAVLSVSSSVLTSDMLRNEVLRAMFIWWIGETVGVLTITPFLLIHVMPRLRQFAEGRPVRSTARRSFPRPTLSVIGQAFSIAFVFYWVFGARGPAEFRPMYLLTLPLIWIALDHGFKGVTTGIVLLNFGVMLAMWFFRLDVARLDELQLLTIVNCLLGLLMGAVVTDRKQAEENLVKSKDLLSETEKTAHIGGWVFDAEKLTQEWTEETFRILEIDVTKGEPKVPEGVDFVAPAFRPMAEQGIRRAIEFGESYDQEWEVITVKGNRRWVHAVAKAYQEQGKTKRVSGSFQDITERKQAEKALLQANDDWENTFESLTDAVTIHDKNYNIIRANTSARRMLQVPLSGNLTSTKCFMCYHGTEKPPEGCPSCRSLVTEQPSVSEFFEPHLNKYLEIRAIPRFDTDHQCIGLVHVVRDITERKRVEAELRESEEYARTLVDNINTGVVMIDAESHVIVDANRAAIAMLHSTKESILGAVCHTFICPAEQGKCPVSDLRQTVDSSERVLLSPRGDKIPVIKSVFPIILHDHSYLLETFVDISDRVRAETDKEVMQAQLRQSQKMETIGKLAGGVAHDFNNLLTGILGNIALVRSSLPPADPLLENLNAAETAARQAATLTKGLLTFSRSAVVVPVSMNITAAIDVSLALLKQSLPSTVSVVRDDEQPAWNVLLDQTQMTQIMLNLVVNARDAMKSKGTVTIGTRSVTIDTAYLGEHSYARTGEFVHLSVTDTGPGMSPDAMQHLFEPFYTTKPAGSGTGLGLSIVYGAVKQAGGWIAAASTEGAGVTFDIYLPRCLEESARLFAPASIPLDVGSGTILVVEDEPIVCAVAQALLGRSGYTVLTAPDGASALNVLREHPADLGLILLDMTMPGMTTDEIVHAIRALNPTIPILLNSGHTSNDTINQMLEEGAVQGFLGKPYTLGELVGKVQELLHRS